MSYATVTFSVTPECKHENGVYRTLRFWIFTKRYFICTDCGEAIPRSELEIKD
ncbi:MAG: hypothetical protein GY861_14070 [bacterium]|nr:hypothetical protein [bacterium]